MTKARPMHAMSLNWHLARSLDEADFPRVSDKLRDQLMELGISPREASVKAPVMLEGVMMSHAGDIDFARIHRELKAENKAIDGVVPTF